MSFNRKTYKTEVDGAPFELEFSDLAGQADAAVVGRWGETTVLATAVLGKEDVNLPYFPLTVDYEERFYAAGKIIGSRFIRREGRPSDEATLSARLIDRAIRPLFDHRLRREVQVVVTILSYDGEHDPDLVSMIAVSAALAVSDIPWGGPVGAARFEKTRAFPNGSEADSEAEAVDTLAFFAGTASAETGGAVRVNMIEFEGGEAPHDVLADYYAKAEQEIKRTADFQLKIVREIGKPKQKIEIREIDPALRRAVRDFAAGKIAEAVKNKTLGELKHDLFGHIREMAKINWSLPDAGDIFEELVGEYVKRLIFEEGGRCDGRAFDEVRPVRAEVGLFRRTHGSGVFARGNTQVLAVVTLASPSGAQLIETMEETGRRRFMLHYNFPSFSVGETGRAKGPGRREIGHGALASKAVRRLIPPKEEFPYAIRVVAETLSSNGSSSMASACAASLALMDAGVPVKKHVAGVAMGLLTDGKGSYKILTDIQGPEDHHGEMDFKVAGTREGVTAVQMDVKSEGITAEIFAGTLAQAERARLGILEKMETTLGAARPELSPYAPRIFKIMINPERIGELIGPGGKTINGIIAACGGQEAVSIDIEQDGTVFVASDNEERARQAVRMVEEIVREYAVGDLVEGKVVRILEFGAIVEFGNKDGMIHISELADRRVEKVEDVVRIGDKVRAKIIRMENGKMALSLRGHRQPTGYE